MKFRTFQLIIDDRIPTFEDMKKIVFQGLKVFRPGVELFEIENSIYEHRFYWMSCQYDNAELYNEHVWNEYEEKKEANPRKKMQIECRQQLFVCYDTQQSYLYMSNMDKRAFLKNYLTETLGKDIIIKNIISSLSGFQAAIKTIKSAKFVQASNIFNNMPDTIFSRTSSIYGLDAPERIILKADYGNTPIGVVKDALYTLQEKLRGGQFESIIIVGEDDAGIEQSFDFSSIIKAIRIDPKKDENGHYDPEEVRILFLNEIR